MSLPRSAMLSTKMQMGPRQYLLHRDPLHVLVPKWWLGQSLRRRPKFSVKTNPFGLERMLEKSKRGSR